MPLPDVFLLQFIAFWDGPVDDGPAVAVAVLLCAGDRTLLLLVHQLFPRVSLLGRTLLLLVYQLFPRVSLHW